MRKIALTQRLLLNESYYEIREALDIHYCKLVDACGFLPVVLPYEVDFKNYFDVCGVDGVLLTGGNDLNTLSSNELSKKRDDFEKELLDYCIEMEIPVFGICRGMQLIAEHFGSSLIKIEGEINTIHTLAVSHNSFYEKYLNKFGMVNSFHSFAVDNLSQDFRVSAYSNKGVIKAIEHKKEKIFGQMWHSEREKAFDPNAIELISDFFNFGLQNIISIAQKAGEAIMEIYKQDFTVQYKEDNSPVTLADIKANEIITEGLQKISAYPILSEETPITYDTRKNWTKFWLVDPLDGTKDFIVKNGAFTINIALIDKNESLLGVVYLPDSGDVYYAIKNGGAFKNGIKIVNKSKRTDLVGSDSNFHSTPETQAFFENYKIKHIERYGSSIKICKLAEGIIDVYPRFNGTKEWDTAAAHIIAKEAGCKLIDIKTHKQLVYNKEDLKNNHFIASRNDLEFDI